MIFPNYSYFYSNVYVVVAFCLKDLSIYPSPLLTQQWKNQYRSSILKILNSYDYFNFNEISQKVMLPAPINVSTIYNLGLETVMRTALTTSQTCVSWQN